MRVANNIIVLGLAVLYVFLAVQAEPITATLGYVAAGILTLALIISTLRRE